jgi:myxalamid-type polyketide synthase MxaE and MxaD
VVLESGTSVVQNGSATTVEPSDHAGLADAVGGAIRTARDLKGVVHLWNLDTSVEETTTALDAAAAKGCGSLLAVVQALATATGRTQPRLWVATEGAVAVGSVPWPVQVGQAPAWGLARVAAIEQPQLRCSIIDLDPGDRGNSAARLLAEIAADDSESQIAHRGGRRFLARLVRQGREQALHMAQAVHAGKIELSQRDVLADEPDRPVIDPEASYLITGGCGGLGLEVAKWLASRGARHLVLTGRSAPGAAAQTMIDGLRAAGPNVTVILGDIASEADVQGLVARLGTTPPLRGVIHAAGVLSDGVLTELTWQRFETVLAPKVRGAWLLDRLTRQHRLDFFVLFSSASAVLGAAGQANYAAANTFLDALAARRRVEGLPALSINWGPWREVGMAARPGASAGQRSADWGIAAIEPRDGVRLLELLLKKPESNVVALPAEWETVLRPFAPGSEPSLLRSIAATERQARERRDASQPAGDLRARLVAAPPAEKLRELRELVRERVALALGVADASRLDFSLSFAKAGLDSLMALEVRNTLSSALGLPLSPAVLFEHPSIEAVAAHLAERIAVDAEAESAAVADPTDLSSMSDEQVDEMLAKLLAESQGDR